MEFNGSVVINAPRDAVWNLLLDFDQLATCGPGVQSIEHLDATHARVKAKVGVAFMTMRGLALGWRARGDAWLITGATR